MNTLENTESNEKNVTQYNQGVVLGQGAYGTVYRGLNRSTKTDDQMKKTVDVDSLVAVKHVILKEFNSIKLSELIEREMEILQALSKPPQRNIVTLLYCQRKSRDIYFVMEFCNGGNLLEYLQSKEKLDEDTIKIFLKQIANGLKVAHRQNIIHRDLKPENLLLCFSGEKCPAPRDITLKIADFGIGRFLASGALAGTFCGSQDYMAPEVLFHRPPGYDYKADLWSVGVIVYQCLVGSLPQSPIATCPVEIPKTKNPALTEMLKGLLEDDQEKRLNSKQFLNHQFLATDVSVTVAGPSNQSKQIHIKDNSSVDDLIDKICNTFTLGRDSENVILIRDGSTLERGSGNSLLDADIEDKSTITFGMRVSGGHNYSDLDGINVLDLYVAPSF